MGGQPQYAQPMGGQPQQYMPEQLMVQNCAKGLNIRNRPDTSGDLLGTLANGSVIVVQSRQGNWVQHQTGWSMTTDGTTAFLAPMMQQQQAQPQYMSGPEQLMVQNCPKGLNIRSQPATGGDLLGTLANGSVIVVQSRNGNWVQHQTGWSLATDGQTPFLMPMGQQGYMQPQQGYMQPQMMGGGVVVATMGMCQHEWIQTGEPSLVAWIICFLTGCCCSLCICTRQRCRKCGAYLD